MNLNYGDVDLSNGHTGISACKLTIHGAAPALHYLYVFEVNGMKHGPVVNLTAFFLLR